jgi:integrase
MSGFCEARLIAAVPRVAEWTLSRLPKNLTREQLDRLLASFDRSTSIGRRDYAMTLCLSQLGLRAQEVVQLLFDDIGWRAGTLQIVRYKSRRANLLPLPPLLGRAIAAYLRRGRPTTNERWVFVRHSSQLAREFIEELYRLQRIEPSSAHS